ncbi:OTU domain-containing protein 5-B [Camellia lanceoleosa]|uniref:OTU domain-containing protein 5-B n=1 Tax=Camellia lanceoleosa TaxID=1840588 RepID=A0ACC0FQB1_9ERIC|nr:OTU domain-containing protein 5-B [Camellia lanceoleosa]
MTRILVQRGSTSSSPNTNKLSSLPGSSSSAPPQLQITTPQVASAVKDDEIGEEVQEQVVVDDFVECFDSGDNKAAKSDDLLPERFQGDQDDDDEAIDSEKVGNDDVGSGDLTKGVGVLRIMDNENDGSSGKPLQTVTWCSYPPPPVPPPKPSSTNSFPRRSVSGSSNSLRSGSSRRAAAWPIVSTRTLPTGSRPSSPRSHCESEGYNSSDEQSPSFGSSYGDAKSTNAGGWELPLRAVADQVYGDSDAYDLVEQMCIDYMEAERDHFSQFITEGFTSYCMRKRRDKVYGNNMEIQALAEMYNRPIHIYAYSTEPINIFHGSYSTDTPPVRLSYHHRNHYNSLVDPGRLTIGAGLGFSCLQGRNVDKDQIKAVIKAQQDQQINNALLAEGRFYSDLELTEKEIERMVMETSRAEFNQQLGWQESSTAGAEPSSSGAMKPQVDGGRERGLWDTVVSSSMQIVLSMGFSYLQVIEAYNIFGDDVDSVVCYLLETGGSSSRRKGKAAE